MGMMAKQMDFHKYLVGRDGITDWFSSVTAPDSAKVRTAVETVAQPRKPFPVLIQVRPCASR